MTKPKTATTVPPSKSSRPATSAAPKPSKSKSNSNSSKSNSKKEEEQELCPICDDVCTCAQQPATDLQRPTHSTSSFKVTSSVSRGASRPKNSKTSTNTRPSTTSSSSFIWDFNVRGQLIPLENLYDDQREEQSEYDSTDAECSDIVSGSESDDHLSEVVDSGNEASDDDDDDDELMEDEMMVYYQHVPVDMPAIDEPDNINQTRISAITPQILAAISKSLYSNGPNKHVIVVSDDGSVSDTAMESGNNENDIEMIIDKASDSETSDHSSDSSSDSESSEGSESALQWSRFKRVPVNAFYRRRHRSRPHHSSLHSLHQALRPSSVDPQFPRRDSSDDDLTSAAITDTTMEEQIESRPLLFHDSLLYY